MNTINLAKSKITTASKFMSYTCLFSFAAIPLVVLSIWVLGGIILMIAWVMGEGKRLADEVEQFV